MRRGWMIRDSLELYNVPNWGAGFFDVNAKGHVEVLPRGTEGAGIDLLELVQDLERRGLRAPLLIRFSDILASRVEGLSRAFNSAIAEYSYQGRYRGVYPIKVNQQRQVVEEVVRYGACLGVGLEAGSKPELLVGARAARHPGRADRVQRLQGPRLHRAGAAGPAPGPHADRGDRPLPRDRPGDQDLARAGHPAASGRARAPDHQGRREVGGVDRRSLEVRPLRARDRGRRRAPARRGHARLPRAAALPHRLADHRDPRAQGRRQGGQPGLRRACTRWGPSRRCSTSAAGSASTTTAPRRTSTARRTTPPRSTRTTWWRTSRRPATRPACRTRTSSPRPGARWWRTTRCWSSTCWA